LEAELEKTRIRAPFAGLVARRYIRVGQTVLKDERDDRCFRISELRPLQVRFLVSEMTARRPRTGEMVNVVPVSDSQRVYPARIVKVSPTVDPASGSYDVTAQLVAAGLTELRPECRSRSFGRRRLRLRTNPHPPCASVPPAFDWAVSWPRVCGAPTSALT
jgi:membrane fusion protein (multidrug efflux system)